MKARSAILLSSIFLFSACGGLLHVSPDEFKTDYRMPIGTMVWSRYLGQKDGRAYVRVSRLSSMGHSSTDEVVYVELSELDPAFRDSLPKDAAPVPAPHG
jgi:hypothetical protein